MSISVVVRVDATASIGTGHLYRCLALTAQLRKRGATCIFVCRGLSETHQALISAAGHELIQLPVIESSMSRTSDGGYADWLAVTEEEDADAVSALSVIDNAIVVVDHYAIGGYWERRVRQRSSALVVIDDLIRAHEADILVDQTPSRVIVDYSGSDVSAVLTGSDYALLAEEFVDVRERRRRRSAQSGKKRLVVSMGGIDHPNATESVIHALVGVSDRFEEIGVVLPLNAPHHLAVSKAVSSTGQPFELYDDIREMPKFLESFDFAIGAPGVSSLERLSIGLPSILIPIAANQSDNAKIIAASGAALVLDVKDLDKLPGALDKLHETGCQMAIRGMKLVDGLGARRVAQCIFPEYLTDRRPVTLRKARADDISITFEWQQDPDNRRFARNSSRPSWEEHSSWMKGKLESLDCYFYLICVGQEPAGVLRLDRDNFAQNTFELSIHVGAPFKRFGVATAGIRLALDLHRNVEVVAEVLEPNYSSHALFKKLGFVQEEKTRYVAGKRQ